VFTLGSYLIPSILGRPEHWTLSVFISDQASFNANVPFASAMAMVLTVLSLILVGVVLLVEAKTRRAA
jgi:putative spermidine/putrescine transport system permease protein